MAAGSSSSMPPPKPVPAWLNSAAWASKPRSPVRSSYSFKEIGTIQRDKSAPPLAEIGAQEDNHPSSSSGGTVRGGGGGGGQQTDALNPARGNGLEASSQQVKFYCFLLYEHDGGFFFFFKLFWHSYFVTCGFVSPSSLAQFEELPFLGKNPVCCLKNFCHPWFQSIWISIVLRILLPCTGNPSGSLSFCHCYC